MQASRLLRGIGFIATGSLLATIGSGCAHDAGDRGDDEAGAGGKGDLMFHLGSSLIVGVAFAVLVPGCAAVSALFGGSSGESYDDICPDMDTSSMPYHAKRHEVEKICSSGTQELMSDYKQFLREADARNWDSVGRRSRSCIVSYVRATAYVAEGEETRGGMTDTSHFSSCAKHCGYVVDEEAGLLSELADKYDAKCVAKKGEWKKQQQDGLKPEYEESLEAFVAAMHEEEWPLYLHHQYVKARALLDGATDKYGENDALVERFEAKLEEIEQGETGERLERAREFLARDEVETILAKLAQTEQEIHRLQDEIDAEDSRTRTSGNRHGRERARSDAADLRGQLRDAKERKRALEERYAHQAIEADLYPSGAGYSYGLRVAPGDMPRPR